MEEKIKDRMDRLNLFIPKEYQETVRELVIGIAEMAKDEAFLDGYQYAVTILNDGLIKMKQ